MTFPTVGTPGAPAVAPAAPAAPAAAIPPTLTGAELNRRIAHGDPAWPKELWGRTLSEAIRFYGVMREDFMRRNDPGAQQPAAQPQPQAQPPMVGRPQMPAQSAQPVQPSAPTGMFSTDQVEQMVAAAVQKAMASSPINVRMAESVQERLRREVPDWSSYETDVIGALEGVSAQQLTDPNTWMTAYYFVKGQRLSQPQQPAAGAPMQPPQVVNYQAAPINNPVSGQPSSFFTEGPTASNASAGGSAVSPNDPRVVAMARRHGVSPEELVLWWGGNVPPASTNGAPHV